MSTLNITGLHKAYGATQALKPTSLNVADGEFIALLGPSGCGKTTLMRMLAGVTEPDGGEITIDGERIDHLPPERRNIGMVFQSFALFPHKRVAENLAFGLRMHRVPKAERESRVVEALKLVGLADKAERYPRQLSGGQQQRVALARAIVLRPRLLLLDEPLSNLDAKLREALRDELRRLQARLQLTSIYVTHDQSEAMALADRVAVMNGGQMIEIGAPADLYQRPRHRFTAEFLGSTNLIPGQVNGNGAKLPWGDTVGVEDAVAGAVSVSLRPEELTVQPRAGADWRVEDVTYLGSHAEYLITRGSHTLIVSMGGKDAALLPVGTSVDVVLPDVAHVLSDSPDDQRPATHVPTAGRVAAA